MFFSRRKKVEEDKENIIDSDILPILKKYGGDTEVILYYAKDKVSKAAPKEYRVRVSEGVMIELKGILGEDETIQ